MFHVYRCDIRFVLPSPPPPPQPLFCFVAPKYLHRPEAPHGLCTRAEPRTLRRNGPNSVRLRFLEDLKVEKKTQINLLRFLRLEKPFSASKRLFRTKWRGPKTSEMLKLFAYDRKADVTGSLGKPRNVLEEKKRKGFSVEKAGN